MTRPSQHVIGVFVHEAEVLEMDFLVSHPVVKVHAAICSSRERLFSKPNNIENWNSSYSFASRWAWSMVTLGSWWRRQNQVAEWPLSTRAPIFLEISIFNKEQVAESHLSTRAPMCHPSFPSWHNHLTSGKARETRTYNVPLFKWNYP